MAHVDTDALVELKEVMEEDFSLLVETYLADTDTRIANLKTSIEEDDADAIRKIAHSIKGSSSNLFAADLASICNKLEECGKANTLDQASELMAQIEQEYQHVSAQLNKLI